MKTVSTKRAITRQAYQFMIFGFGGAALGAFLLVLSALLSRLPLAAPNTAGASSVSFIVSVMQVIGGIAVLAGIIAFLRGVTFRRDNPLAEKVGRVLAPALSGDYTYVSSINSLRLGYIDAVLVGPPGVLVFRIIDRAGLFLHEGQNWLKPAADGRWLPAGFNASHECIVDMRAVKNLLTRKQLPTEAVFGIVILTGKAEITEKTPVLPGVSLDGMLERLRGGYMAKPRLDPAMASAIAHLLAES